MWSHFYNINYIAIWGDKIQLIQKLPYILALQKALIMYCTVYCNTEKNTPTPVCFKIIGIRLTGVKLRRNAMWLPSKVAYQPTNKKHGKYGYINFLLYIYSVGEQYAHIYISKRWWEWHKNKHAHTHTHMHLSVYEASISCKVFCMELLQNRTAFLYLNPWISSFRKIEKNSKCKTIHPSD